MARIDVRDVPDDVAYRINDMARSKGLSREEYVRRILQTHAMAPDLQERDVTYASLINKLVEMESQFADVLERVEIQLKRLESDAWGEDE